MKGIRRADGDAVAAVDAGRVRQRDIEFGADPVVEAAAAHGDSEGPLGIFATGFDALVTKHTAVIGPDVEVVFDLDRVGHSLGCLIVVTIEVSAVVVKPSHDVFGLADIT